MLLAIPLFLSVLKDPTNQKSPKYLTKLHSNQPKLRISFFHVYFPSNLNLLTHKFTKEIQNSSQNFNLKTEERVSWKIACKKERERKK